MTFYIILALILSVFAIAPLCYPGYFQTHSGFTPLWNVIDLRANWGHWTWIPQVAINFDPLRSDGLLPYYLAGILPLEAVTAVKLVMGLGWLLGNVGMFLWLKNWLGPAGALSAGLVYTYLPHQITTLYVRGAWGESFFWGWLPWAIWAATFSVTSPKLSVLLIVAWCWFSLGLSQLGLTIWALIFMMILLLTLHRTRSFRPIGAALLGAAAAVMVYASMTTFSSVAPVTFTDHFLYPFQLFSAYWGFGASRSGWADGLSFQLGLAAIGLAMLTIILLWQRPTAERPQLSRMDRRLIFFTGTAIIVALLQFKPTVFIWNLPIAPGYALAGLLAYPWQLLGFSGLGLAVLAGAALWLDKQLTHLPLFGAIVILVVLSSYNYLAPQFIPIDQYLQDKPQAQLGEAQLTLLSHDFSVMTHGNTAGLELGQTTIPLAVSEPLQGNHILNLDVTWQPLQIFADDLKIFVHLVDSNDHILAQFDGQPKAGTYPTSQWIPGEIIADSYPILFPDNAPPGPYRVFVGLYDEASGLRLPVLNDSEGRVMLDVE